MGYDPQTRDHTMSLATKNPNMTLVSDLPTPASTQGLGAQRRLTVIQLLHARGQYIDIRIAACRKNHALLIGEATKEMNALIEQADPPRKDALDRVHAIRSAKGEIDDRKRAKAAELDSLTASRKETEQALVEAIQSKIDDTNQLGLDLGDKLALADGLGLSPGTIQLADAEARRVIAAKGEGSAPSDVTELALAIAGMGISGEKFIVAPSEDVDDSDGGEDLSGEAPEDDEDDPSF